MSSFSDSPLYFVYPGPGIHRMKYSFLDVVNVSWSSDVVDQYVNVKVQMLFLLTPRRVTLQPGTSLQLSLWAHNGTDSREYGKHQANSSRIT